MAAAVAELINAETWRQAVDVVRATPALLTSASDDLLDEVIAHLRPSGDEEAAAAIEARRLVLRCWRACIAAEALLGARTTETVNSRSTTMDRGPASASSSRVADDPAALAARLNELFIGLSDRYDHSGDLRDLDVAIEAAECAAWLADDPSGGEGAFLANLAVGLLDRYEARGDDADLARALKASARSLTILGGPVFTHLPAAALSYARAVSLRFEHGGTPIDPQPVVDTLRDAISAAAGDAEREAVLSGALGGVLAAFAAAGDNVAQLDDAIAMYRRALGGLPTNARWHNDLGLALLRRYDLEASIDDLDAAIGALERAVELGPTAAPEAPATWTNLGLALADRFERLHDARDLDAAVALFTRAVDDSPPASPWLPTLLTNLGGGLTDRFALSHDDEDVNQAVAVLRRARSIVPPASTKAAAIAIRLAMALRCRHRQRGNPTDLDEAVVACRHAVSITSPTAATLPGWLNVLGLTLRDRSCAASRRGGDETEAIVAFRRACREGLEMDPAVAFATSCEWSDWAFTRREWSEAAEGGELGLQALDRLIRAQSSRSNKETWVRDAKDLGTRAAFAFVALDCPASAVMALELSRAVLLMEALKPNVSELKLLGHDELVARHRRAAARLRRIAAGHEASD